MASTLLMLPGLLCDCSLWRSQIDALSGRIHCVVADMTQDATLEAMVTRAVASLPDRFAVAGLSMGGYAALALMRMAPDRVSGLALLDTSARADTADRVAHRKALMGRVEDGAFDAVIEEHFPSFVHPSRLDDTALMTTIRGAAHAVGPAAYVNQQRAIMARPDSRDGLAAIACPSLVLCGAEDALTPPALHHEMADMIPGAELVTVPGSGHLPTLERPDAVSAALDAWLRRID